MRKFILYSISFFFISMMLLLSCSENANDVLTIPKVSSITTYVDENVSLDYAELGKLPDVYTKGMDKEEKEAWEKLSTKYRIKKNALSSKFYQEHKAEIIERIKFLYQYAVDKNLPPTKLSFIWADKETAIKPLRLLNGNDSIDVDGPDVDSDSGYVDKPNVKSYYVSVYCTAYGDYNRGISITVSLPYEVVEDGYYVSIEATGPSTYTLEPTNAYFSDYADMTIRDRVALCQIKGEIYYNYWKYPVSDYSTYDLYERFKKYKPQC